jgi:POT family proton-dependent oligopeptide transporter
MLKKHPGGLLIAFFANMGERFGFYTMMAILVLFLQARYDLTAEKAGNIYSWFYFSIYALALVGGILADATRRYKTVIMFGIIIMFIGYLLMAIPGMTLSFTVVALFIIAFGNGLFKGNLQAVVGQMYDDPKYSGLRDTAYMIFYMGINVGAFFAPYAANGIRNWWLRTNGFAHDASLPSLCHQLINGTMTDTSTLQALADKVSLAGPVDDLALFANNYLDLFTRGYNYAFGIAAGAMVISMLVYIFFNRLLPNKEKTGSVRDGSVTGIRFNFMPLIYALIAMGVFAAGLSFIAGLADGLAFGLFAGFITWILTFSGKDEKPRIVSLILVFIVVVFFWMAMHQNGLVLTLFARDYTVKQVGPFTNLFFTLPSMLAVIGSVAGAAILVRKKATMPVKTGGALLLVAALAAAWLFIAHSGINNAIEPEVFQSFNPLFIVALTFPVIGLFAWMNRKGIEPSTPRKIGMGMIITAIGFTVVLIPSVGLPSPSSLAGSPLPDTMRVTPYWLMSSYLILTVAELFLSPMGLSFVSKVAPSRFQGMMQAGWLLATATGNKLLFVGTKLWDSVDLWQMWIVFIGCCLLSAVFIFSIMKRLENATR